MLERILSQLECLAQQQRLELLIRGRKVTIGDVTYDMSGAYCWEEGLFNALIFIEARYIARQLK